MSADAALAYVFWHARQPQVARDEYERCHFEFHRILRANAPAGYRGSRVQRLSRAPWPSGAPEVPETYEDWYYLDDSAALDAINEAAVGGVRRAPHDRVALLAAAGIAGLYRLRAGRREARAPRALWFSKPAGTSYPALLGQFAQRDSDEALWMRQMTLGPTPEFCLQTDAGLPVGLAESARLEIGAIWEFSREGP